MEKLPLNRILYTGATFIALLATQVLLGKAGHFVANQFSYTQIDPHDAFASISVHHFAQMVFALIIIIALGKLLKIDFYLKLGNIRKGTKYVAIFTGVFAFAAIMLHLFLSLNNQLPTYAFPLDCRNILGTIGFQLFLSGPSEEVIFRALPITILVYTFGRSIQIRKSFTVEVIMASILFSFAHLNWSLAPFSFEVDSFQLVYAVILGTIQGIVYQKTESIVYPALMHSFSNVIMVGTGYLFTALTVA